MVNQVRAKKSFYDEFESPFPPCQTLAKERRDRGLSQADLGYSAGVPAQRISNLENGTDRSLSKAVAAKLSQALGLESRELFPEYYWRFSEEYIASLEAVAVAAWPERAKLSGEAVFALQQVQEFREAKSIIIPEID